MAESIDLGKPHPVPVISPDYCAPYPVDLAVAKKVPNMQYGDFVVTDIDGNILFKVKPVKDRRVLIDAIGSPIVTLQMKGWSLHDRWQAFREESRKTRDMLFTLKRSSLFQKKTKYDVFLGRNTKSVREFRVEGSWSERCCTFWAADSSAPIAQMHKGILVGKDKFTVTVYRNVDFAFIISLIVILDAINERSSCL